MTQTAVDSSDNPEQKSKTTRERLFDTAVEMFSQQGFHAVSIRDLTRAVGIKESSFYNHFTSKDALIEAIFQQVEIEFTAMFPPQERIEPNLGELSPQGFLEAGIQVFLNRMTAQRNQSLWRLLFMEQYRDPRARSLINRAFIQQSLEYSAEVFRLMIERGSIKPLDPHQLAAGYFYPVAMLCTRLMSGDLDRDETEKQLIDHAHFFWSLIQK